eukprot:3137387-Amphidinium_carterae.1
MGTMRIVRNVQTNENKDQDGIDNNENIILMEIMIVTVKVTTKDNDDEYHETTSETTDKTYDDGLWALPGHSKQVLVI